MNERSWSGTVTTKNIDKVCELMHKYLDGKKYTSVLCYEYKRYKPEVRLHQELREMTDGSTISVCHHNENHSQLLHCDTYGMGGFSTTLTDDGYVYDSKFNAPYISFEHMHTISITNRAPNGLLYYEVLKVE
jgi:hypothetical protein